MWLYGLNKLNLGHFYFNRFAISATRSPYKRAVSKSPDGIAVSSASVGDCTNTPTEPPKLLMS